MSTIIIGTLIFLGVFIVAAIIIQWYVVSNTREEEFKHEHRM